jgi:hypothetical protein
MTSIPEDKNPKPSKIEASAGKSDKASSLRFLKSDFLGLSKDDFKAVFQIERSDEKVDEIAIEKDTVLRIIKSVLQGQSKIPVESYLTKRNFLQIAQAYEKRDLLDQETSTLLKQTIGNLQKKKQEEAAAIQKLSKAIPSTNSQEIATQPGDQELVDEITAGLKAASEKPEIENFNAREDKEKILKDLFSKQESKTKMLTEDLIPHFRHILNKPELHDQQIREVRNQSIASPQKAVDLKRLRDEFMKAVAKNETASLNVWLKSDLGQRVSENLEAILYDTASHVHRQILHQLKKGKQADQQVISNQITSYIKTTNILASIAKRQTTN